MRAKLPELVDPKPTEQEQHDDAGNQQQQQQQQDQQQTGTGQQPRQQQQQRQRQDDDLYDIDDDELMELQAQPVVSMDGDAVLCMLCGLQWSLCEHRASARICTSLVAAASMGGVSAWCCICACAT